MGPAAALRSGVPGCARGLGVRAAAAGAAAAAAAAATAAANGDPGSSRSPPHTVPVGVQYQRSTNGVRSSVLAADTPRVLVSRSLVGSWFESFSTLKVGSSSKTATRQAFLADDVGSAVELLQPARATGADRCRDGTRDPWQVEIHVCELTFHANPRAKSSPHEKMRPSPNPTPPGGGVLAPREQPTSSPWPQAQTIPEARRWPQMRDPSHGHRKQVREKALWKRRPGFALFSLGKCRWRLTHPSHPDVQQGPAAAVKMGESYPLQSRRGARTWRCADTDPTGLCWRAKARYVFCATERLTLQTGRAKSAARITTFYAGPTSSCNQDVKVQESRRFPKYESAYACTVNYCYKRTTQRGPFHRAFHECSDYPDVLNSSIKKKRDDMFIQPLT
ncbi:hypothetical protein JEQ12_002320 [Ovis aries]|uniref:Uncharacterized protein n=1 Tax=Ovis aries TaxID=9940 RepID=A0A835ZZY3_SHEEP|nr:hypothetical protein JEQ12_002320 [Ovis aries]